MSLPIKNPLTTLGFSAEPGSLKAFYSKFGSNWSVQEDKLPFYINTPTFFNASLENITPTFTPQTTEKKGSVAKFKEGLGKALDDFVSSLDPRPQSSSTLYDIFEKKANAAQPGTYPSVLLSIQDAYGVNLSSDFCYFVQSIEIPPLTLDTEQFDSPFTPYFLPTQGAILKAGDNKITLSLLDAVAPINEYVFYPWMREVYNPIWSYPTQPYTLADLKIDFMHPAFAGTGSTAEGAGLLGEGIGQIAEYGKRKALDVTGSLLGDTAKSMLDGALSDPTAKPMFQYIFKNCYPTQVDLIQPSQKFREEFTRKVVLTFSHVIIKCSYQTTISVTHQLIGKGLEVVNKGITKLTSGVTSRLPGNY